MKIVFFGSGPFGAPTLRRLSAHATRHPIALVVSRPDRPQRRGRKLAPTPIRALAEELDLPCATPESANAPEFLEDLARLEADIFLVADYGEMLRKRLRGLPRIGVFNLHGSLLPRHRGAAPVAHAILAGDKETGVSLFRIEKGLDSGPVVDFEKTSIRPEENAAELEERLAQIAAGLCERSLDPLAGGNFMEVSQDDEDATLAPKIEKGQGAVPWSLEASALTRFVRAMSPWPGAFTFLRSRGKSPERVILRRVRPGRTGDASAALPCGVVERVADEAITVRCRGGSLDILELQREGKAPLESAAFLRGRPLSPGDAFGPEEGQDRGADRTEERT